MMFNELILTLVFVVSIMTFFVIMYSQIRVFTKNSQELLIESRESEMKSRILHTELIKDVDRNKRLSASLYNAIVKIPDNPETYGRMEEGLKEASSYLDVMGFVKVDGEGEDDNKG